MLHVEVTIPPTEEARDNNGRLHQEVFHANFGSFHTAYEWWIETDINVPEEWDMLEVFRSAGTKYIQHEIQVLDADGLLTDAVLDIEGSYRDLIDEDPPPTNVQSGGKLPTLENNMVYVLVTFWKEGNEEHEIFSSIPDPYVLLGNIDPAHRKGLKCMRLVGGYINGGDTLTEWSVYPDALGAMRVRVYDRDDV